MELKVIAEESGNNIGYSLLYVGSEEPLNWHDLSREEQLRIVNLFAQGAEFFSKFIKDE